MLQDLRYACRLVVRTPLLSATAILALALGIGATTALFSVVQAVILAPLPYPDPDRLVVVATRPDPSRRAGATFDYALTGGEATAVRELTDVFAHVSVAELWTVNWSPRFALAGPSAAERIRGALVDDAFFDTLAISPLLGQTFRTGDPHNDGVVISHSLWRRQFDEDTGAIGQTIRINGDARPVIGVLPRAARLTYPLDTDAYVLRPPGPLVGPVLAFQVVARLQPGVSMESATASLTRITSRGDPTIRSELEVQRLHDRMARPVASGIWLVAAAAAVLCVTACANAALLLLTRTVRRVRDTGVRMALGAGRARLLRQAITESLVVGVAGTTLGVALAQALHPFIIWLAPPEIPRLDEMALNVPVLAFAWVAGLLGAVAAGLASYRVMTGVPPGLTAGQLGLTATAGRRTLAWRRVLLAGQTAMLVVLLSVAGLLLHSFLNVWRIDLGFVPNGITAFQLTGARVSSGGDPAEPSRRLKETVTQVRTMMQSDSAHETIGIASGTPFIVGPGHTFVPQSRTVPTDGQPSVPALWRHVTEDYLDILGVPLREGRGFTSADMVPEPNVAIVSAGLARHLFPGRSAVGQTLHWDDAFEIIGVVDDVRWLDPEEPAIPTFYLPVSSMSGGPFHLVVQSTRPLEAVSATVHELVGRIDPLQPIDRVMPLEALVEDAMAERRFHALATGGFGVLALLLGGVGIFGGVAAAVSERRREIGIRIALGATAARVRWFAMQHSLLPVAAGALCGVVGAAWATRVLEQFLFELSSSDPRTLGVIGVVLVSVAVVASWMPAQRAVQTDPAAVLRDE